MHPIDAAILRTVLYADIFHFPMSADEIHHFLIHCQVVPYSEVCARLDASPDLRRLLCHASGYYAWHERAEIIAIRQQRAGAAAALWTQALRYGRWLARLPFVRMVAVTGALSMENADDDDDLDYMIVTEPGRVWLARLFAVTLVRIVQIRGPIICPNYVVAANALTQNRRDLFIAHEVTQMIPLYGWSLYDDLRACNDWVRGELPNAETPFHTVQRITTGAGWTQLKRSLEALLGGGLGDRLEHWERQRKQRRFAGALQTPHSAAQVDETQVKGHFNDYGYSVMRAYRERLSRCGLVEQPVSGD